MGVKVDNGREFILIHQRGGVSEFDRGERPVCVFSSPLKEVASAAPRERERERGRYSKIYNKKEHFHYVA